MIQYQAWLPKECLNSPRLAEPVGNGLKSWCQDWFANAVWEAADKWTETERPISDDPDLSLAFRLDNGVSCWLTAAGKFQLGRSMLNLADNKAARGQMDQRLVNALGSRALSDLSDRLQILCKGPEPTAAPVEFYALTRSINYEIKATDKNRQAMMFIQADTDFLVNTARSLAPPARVGPRIAARSEATELSKVVIGARLGMATLTLSEIEGLGIGDVIALDAPVDEPLIMTIDGAIVAAGQVSVEPDSETLTLQLTRSSS